MSFENTSKAWTVKQLAKMADNGSFDFSHIVQRSYRWEKERATYFIDSLVRQIPIPEIYAKRIKFDDKNVYVVMDGKQRLTTLSKFFNNELRLGERPPIKFFNEEENEYQECDISGKTYEEFPDAVKERINSVTIKVTFFDRMEPGEEIELFKRINNGKPLSTKEKRLADTTDLESVLDIGKHPVFEDILTNSGLEGKNQVNYILKTWCMLNKPLKEISFEKKEFDAIAKEMIISDGEKEKISKVFNYFTEIFHILDDKKEKKVKSIIKKETHFVSLVSFVNESIEKKVSEELFAEWVVDFFKFSRDSESFGIYNEAATKNTAGNDSIKTRDRILKESYSEFFKQDDALEDGKSAVSDQDVEVILSEQTNEGD